MKRRSEDVESNDGVERVERAGVSGGVNVGGGELIGQDAVAAVLQEGQRERIIKHCSNGREFDAGVVASEIQYHYMAGSMHYLEVGKRLLWASAEMGYGELGPFIEEKTPIARRTAFRWMATAERVVNEPRLRRMFERIGLTKTLLLADELPPEELEELFGNEAKLDEYARQTRKELQENIRRRDEKVKELEEQVADQKKELTGKEHKIRELRYDRYAEEMLVLRTLHTFTARFCEVLTEARAYLDGIDLVEHTPEIRLQVRHMWDQVLQTAKHYQLDFEEGYPETPREMKTREGLVMDDPCYPLPMDYIRQALMMSIDPQGTAYIKAWLDERNFVHTDQEIADSIKLLVRMKYIREEVDQETGELRYAAVPWREKQY